MELETYKPFVVIRRVDKGMVLRNYFSNKEGYRRYLNNLMAWGDQLYRRDTREPLNEALQIYVLAAQILGRKPASVPRRINPKTQSFFHIQGKLDSLSNIQVSAENALPPLNSPGQANIGLPAMPGLLFCVPENPKILEYYDKVADRLFKLRNCMNADGVKRQLPLFNPPIDPAVLVKASVAGIDLSAALNDLVPNPLYRFNVLSQKATEICNEVKNLGGALLSALEKRDTEAMASLRSQHEIGMLQLQRQTKKLQVEEAKGNIEALAQSLESAHTRLAYYVGMVSSIEYVVIPTGPAGQQSDKLIIAALDTVGKTAGIFAAVNTAFNPLSAAGFLLLNQALSKATEALTASLPQQDGDASKVAMIPAEKKQLEELKQLNDFQQKSKE